MAEELDAVAVEDALKGVLASLVAITSLVIRAEDEKKQPSKVVASDKMFRQMLVDYDKATVAARAALASAKPAQDGDPSPFCYYCNRGLNPDGSLADTPDLDAWKARALAAEAELAAHYGVRG